MTTITEITFEMLEEASYQFLLKHRSGQAAWVVEWDEPNHQGWETVPSYEEALTLARDGWPVRRVEEPRDQPWPSA
jgi:hypothetical protein